VAVWTRPILKDRRRFAQPPDQVGWGEQPQAPGRQLDRQREPVEEPDELRAGRIVLEANVESLRRPRQQRERIRRFQTVERQPPLARAAQGQLRGREHAHVRQPAQQRVQQGAGAGHSLEVVQHEQHRTARSKIVDQRLVRRSLGADPAFAGDHGAQPGGIALLMGIDPPHTPRVVLQQTVGRRQRQARLANAATAEHCDQPLIVTPQRRAHAFQIAIATDQTSGCHGHAARPQVQRSGGRERPPASTVDDGAVQRDRRRKVLQAVRAEGLARHHLSQQLRRDPGHQQLPTVRGRTDTGRPMDLESHITVSAALDLADVQTHPHPQFTCSLRPGMGAQPSLKRNGSTPRLRDIAERDEEPVAGGPVDPPAGRAHHALHDLVIGPQDFRPLTLQGCRQASRALDIGEQHRDQTARRPDARTIHATSGLCQPRCRVQCLPSTSRARQMSSTARRRGVHYPLSAISHGYRCWAPSGHESCP